jgi:hypothetical protein
VLFFIQGRFHPQRPYMPHASSNFQTATILYL